VLPRRVDNMAELLVTLPESRAPISNPNGIILVMDNKDFQRCVVMLDTCETSVLHFWVLLRTKRMPVRLSFSNG
jgi:hypothetical protein